MKKHILALLAIMIMVGCKDNPVSEKIRETKETVTSTTKAVNEITKMQDDILELQKLTPLTNDELKTWLPDQINGMKRIAFKAGQAGMIQISSIEATYVNEDKSKKFNINIIDGAGQVGASAISGVRIMLTQDFEEEDENKTRKTVTKKGVKAIEEYRKINNNSNIKFLEDRRFYIEAKGTNMDIDETWDAINEMDVDDLT